MSDNTSFLNIDDDLAQLDRQDPVYRILKEMRRILEDLEDRLDDMQEDLP